jgi:hypothetical protein
MITKYIIMSKKQHTYICSLCKKEYASSNSLWCHNKKYHDNQLPNDDLLLINNLMIKNNNLPTKHKLYNCKYCNKLYNIQQSRWKHELTCKKKINILQENIKLKQELNTIKINKIMLLNSNNRNINNGNINNGIINANNNTVTINKIGTEPIVFKTKDIKMIANDGMNGPMTCAKQLNFNKNNPANHSYCVTSLEGEYCKAINHITQQPEIVPKKEIIDQVFESAYRFIEAVAIQIKEDDSLRKKLSIHEIKEINRIVENKNKYYEKKNRKTFYNSINSMSYNYRDLVLSTWKLLKPLEDNLISDDNQIIETDSNNNLTLSDNDLTLSNNDLTLSDNDLTLSDDDLTLFDLIKYI